MSALILYIAVPSLVCFFVGLGLGFSEGIDSGRKESNERERKLGYLEGYQACRETTLRTLGKKTKLKDESFKLSIS